MGSGLETVNKAICSPVTADKPTEIRQLCEEGRSASQGWNQEDTWSGMGRVATVEIKGKGLGLKAIPKQTGTGCTSYSFFSRHGFSHERLGCCTAKATNCLRREGTFWSQAPNSHPYQECRISTDLHTYGYHYLL